MARLRSLLYFLFLAITVIPYAFACILWAPLPLRWRYRLTVGWPRLAIWGAKVFCGIRWQVKGWENLPDGPAVILSKHQSAWETLFFPAHMPREVCFVYKKELHMVPFFGWGLALLRMIAIDRSKGRDAFDQVVKQGQTRMDEGRWPLLFPKAPACHRARLRASRWAARCLPRVPARLSFPWRITRASAGGATLSSNIPAWSPYRSVPR